LNLRFTSTDEESIKNFRHIEIFYLTERGEREIVHSIQKNLITIAIMGRAGEKMYAIFKFNSGDRKIDELYRDDIISRQTIIKRDTRSLGMEGSDIYILIEGSEEAIEKVRKIAGEFEMKDEEKERIYRKIKEAEEEASLGMGAIFG